MTGLVGISTPTLLVYAVSLVLVMWAVADISKRPPNELSSGKKAVWILGSVVGWLFFGIAGAFVAIVYLVGPRRRMNVS